VVVSDEDGDGVVEDGGPEDFTGVNKSPVDKAGGYAMGGYEVVGTVEGDDEEGLGGGAPMGFEGLEGGLGGGEGGRLSYGGGEEGDGVGVAARLDEGVDFGALHGRLLEGGLAAYTGGWGA
jgi:hypothetical protein